MAVSEVNVTFREEIKSQDEIRGRLVSGQRFSGKVHLVATDYFQIVELKVENASGTLAKVDLDIVKMRYDAVAFFGHK